MSSKNCVNGMCVGQMWSIVFSPYVCVVLEHCFSLLLCVLKAISTSQEECKCECASVQPAIYTVMSIVFIPMYKAHVVQG